MEEDRERWNQRYMAAEEPGDPSPILTRYIARIPPGRALDLACGRGRNALFLARAGFQVDAVDISDRALEGIQHPNIHTIRRDLDDYAIEPATYDLILDFLFLDRNLYQGIQVGLKPGGFLIFETALQENEHIGNPAYKLRPGELPEVFAGFEQLFYNESQGRACLVARKT